MPKTLVTSSKTWPWRESLRCSRSNHTIATTSRNNKNRTTSSPTLPLKATRKCTKTKMVSSLPILRKHRMTLPAPKTKMANKFKSLKTR